MGTSETFNPAERAAALDMVLETISRNKVAPDRAARMLKDNGFGAEVFVLAEGDVQSTVADKRRAQNSLRGVFEAQYSDVLIALHALETEQGTEPSRKGVEGAEVVPIHRDAPRPPEKELRIDKRVLAAIEAIVDAYNATINDNQFADRLEKLSHAGGLVNDALSVMREPMYAAVIRGAGITIPESLQKKDLRDFMVFSIEKKSASL